MNRWKRSFLSSHTTYNDTASTLIIVVPAEAGILNSMKKIPAFAGMTGL